MKMIYNVEDKLSFKQTAVYSLQQFLAVVCATILVPLLVNTYGAVNLGISPAAALFGAGIATLFYVWVTKKKSPIFIGSSFAFLPALYGATAYGWWGLIIGGIFAGAIYGILSFVVWKKGTKWIDKLMPAVIIGPTVALIGLSLSGSAINNLTSASGGAGMSYNFVGIICGLFSFGVTVFVSCKGSKKMRLMPFIIGIGAGYLLSAFFSIFGYACNVPYLKICNWDALVANFQPVKFTSFLDYPHLAIIEAIKSSVNGTATITGAGVGQLALLFIPVAFVVFAEHIADHKNMSSIIEKDLLTDPGLHRTLIGDGFGTTIGTILGCCPNTTYGESIGCVAITKNASIYTIIGAAVIAIIVSFFSPFIALINTIPACVLGGVCLALYGFIAVSGLKMLQGVDLGDSRNLFVVSAILVSGVGGLVLNFTNKAGQSVITITTIATALIIGILTNTLLSIKTKKEKMGIVDADEDTIAEVGENVVFSTDDKVPATEKTELTEENK